MVVFRQLASQPPWRGLRSTITKPDEYPGVISSMTRFTSTIIITLTIMSVISKSSANADEIFSAAACANSTYGSGNYNVFNGYIEYKKYINVYIQEDIGDEIVDCIDFAAQYGYNPKGQIHSLPSVTRNTNVINSVLAATEIWNQESRGAVLRYRGTLPFDTAQSACSSMEKPAVFVGHRDGCRPSGIGGCSNAVASVSTEFIDTITCPGVEEMTIWGDNDTNGVFRCAGPNVHSDDLSLDGEHPPAPEVVRDLVGGLVHEFGHVLNFPDYLTGINPGLTVMHPGEAFWPQFGRHLTPFDQDCVDDSGLFDTGNSTTVKRFKRELRHYWAGFNSSGNYISTVSNLNSPIIRKGERGSGSMTHSVGNYYMMYEDVNISEERAYTNGSFSFSSQANFPPQTGAPIYDIKDLYRAPSMVDLHELSESYRMVFNQVSTIGASLPRYYNPTVESVTSSTFFNSLGTPKEFKVCSDLFCVNAADLQSNIPPAFAWDAVSQNSVLTAVATTRSAGYGETDSGEIFIYPGVASDAPGETVFRLGSRLGANRTPPADSYSGFDFTLKTDVSPAVTCAPSSPWLGQSYNCMLAWVDRGILEKRILYSFFRINTSFAVDFIEWEPGSPNVYGLEFSQGVSSNASVSAGYFADRFWIAWKSTDNDVCYISTTALTPNWGNKVCLGRSNVVDPPSWHYRDGSESVLIWTELRL